MLQNESIQKASALFKYLCYFILLFTVFEICHFIHANPLTFSELSSAKNHLHFPSGMIPATLFFLIMQFLIHFALLIFIFIQTLLVSKVFGFNWKQTENFGFILLGCVLIAILLANQYYFPNSIFAIFSFVPVSKIILILFSVSFALILLISLYGIFRFLPVVVILGSLILAYLHPEEKIIQDGASVSHPNVIIIGIDSVRPDFLGYFKKKDSNTPHIDTFLREASVFRESITPIARTFPSWMAILTGKYPKESGARTDLENIRHINLTDTLPTVLKNAGYYSIFATDETRFSNIDTEMGFDQIISPPIGFNDFLLGTLNDFPLSNLLVNTVLGKKLFPYSYANRPAAVTYQPNTFLEMMRPALFQSRKQPLFLAVHFCLPHTPYYWSNVLPHNNPIENYQLALHRADRQVGDFLKLLEKSSVLDHAVVILLSDHGEAIELHGDRITKMKNYLPTPKYGIPRFYPPSYQVELVDQSAGHGTDVLGLVQYRNLLAFKLYGGALVNQAALISGRVSLLDIKPTILTLLNIKPTHIITGQSLKDAIIRPIKSIETHRDLFVESDFSPQAVRSVHPEMKNIIFSGIDYFEVNPVTLHLDVKDNMEKLIIASKQYANYSGDWVLALYPQKNHLMLPVLVNLKTGKWTCNLTSSFAKHSPAIPMLSALRHFYGNEIGQVTSQIKKS